MVVIFFFIVHRTPADCTAAAGTGSVWHDASQLMMKVEANKNFTTYIGTEPGSYIAWVPLHACNKKQGNTLEFISGSYKSLPAARPNA
jgi:hypothetical protein